MLELELLKKGGKKHTHTHTQPRIFCSYCNFCSFFGEIHIFKVAQISAKAVPLLPCVSRTLGMWWGGGVGGRRMLEPWRQAERAVVCRESFEEDPFANTMRLPQFWNSHHWPHSFWLRLPSQGSSLGVRGCCAGLHWMFAMSRCSLDHYTLPSFIGLEVTVETDTACFCCREVLREI